MSDRKVRTSVLTVHPELIKVITEGNIKLNPFELIDHEENGEELAKRLKKALLAGRFEISGGLQTEPVELAKIDNETEVILRRNGIDTLISANSALEEIRKVVNRQKIERFEFNEIGTILAHVSGGNASYIRAQQLKAFEDGRLVFFQDGSPVDPTTFNHPMGALGFWDEYSTPEKINQWLVDWGAEYRFPSMNEAQKERVKPKSIRQEEAIINWLKLNYHDPLALPKNPKGKAGVKSNCKGHYLANTPDLFTKDTFDSTWKRLRREMRIIDRKP